MKSNPSYSTSNTKLAAFLRCHGLRVIGQEIDNKGQVIFKFDPCGQDVDGIAQEFYANSAVPITTYNEHLHELMKRIHDLRS